MDGIHYDEDGIFVIHYNKLMLASKFPGYGLRISHRWPVIEGYKYFVNLEIFEFKLLEFNVKIGEKTPGNFYKSLF